MSDEKESGAVEGLNTETQAGNTEARTFTQAEVDALIKERLERERKKHEAQAETTRKQAELKAAEEQGNWKTLAEQRESELKTMQAQLRETQIKAIAARLGISDTEYAVYLVTKAGEDADPEQVLKERAAKAPAPSLPQNATNPAQPLRFTPEQIAKMSPQEINQHWEAISQTLAAHKR